MVATVLNTSWPLEPTAAVLTAYCLPGCRLVKTFLLEVVAVLIHTFSSVPVASLIWCRKLSVPFGRVQVDIISPLLRPGISLRFPGAVICLGSGCFLRIKPVAVSYTHLRAHETGRNLVCRLLLE